MALEHVLGPGSVAMWDQGLAAAREALGKSCAFVLVTCEKGSGQVEFACLSSGLSPAGMISLLDSTMEGALGTIPQLEAVIE